MSSHVISIDLFFNDLAHIHRKTNIIRIIITSTIIILPHKLQHRQHTKRGETLKEVEIYTDGACSGNPGPGGWAAILMHGDAAKELSGGEPATTNNRMELFSVITALSALKMPCRVKLYTDSQYVSNAISLGWLDSWQKMGWKRKGGELKNIDLWQDLVPLLEKHDVTFIWVKGHADNPHNNRCDELAVMESKKFAENEKEEKPWFEG